jgi:hypothetical protein
LLVRNSSTDGTIKLAVEIGRDQLRGPAAGTQTESQLAAKRRFGHPQIVFGFAKKLSQTGRRISRVRGHFSRGANFSEPTVIERSAEYRASMSMIID